MSVVHCLKIKPLFFAAVSSGKKSFEVRLNDRHFHLGDVLILREWHRGKYTGNYIVRQICYIYDWNLGLAEGYVVLGLTESSVKLDAVQIALAMSVEDSTEYEDDC